MAAKKKAAKKPVAKKVKKAAPKAAKKVKKAAPKAAKKAKGAKRVLRSWSREEKLSIIKDIQAMSTVVAGLEKYKLYPTTYYRWLRALGLKG